MLPRNESGFRPPLCTYRLNWARRTSWGWWDDWGDTVLQTQDSKFEPWRSEAEHATSRSRRLPTILTFTRGWGRNIFVSLKPPRPGTEPRTLAWKAALLTTTLGPPPMLPRMNQKMLTYRIGRPYDKIWYFRSSTKPKKMWVENVNSKTLRNIVVSTAYVCLWAHAYGRSIYVSILP